MKETKMWLKTRGPLPQGQDLVLQVADEEIDQIAELLSRTAHEYDVVIGGDAAERVAKKAGVAGDLCRSIADPALAEGLSVMDWKLGQQQPNSSTWLDGVHAIMSIESYSKDNADDALRHNFALAKAELQNRRGARTQHRA